MDRTLSPSKSSSLIPVRRRGEGSAVLRTTLASKTAIVSLRADAPLKLLSPRCCGRAAWIVSSTYGGGLLAGDEISITLDAGERTTALLTTQASTKIYRSPRGISASQHLVATIAQSALIAVLPDPLTCFSGAVFEQHQRFNLAPDGSLILLDWMTSGRSARGENWDFTRVSLANGIFVGDRRVLADRTILDAADGRIGGVMRTGDCGCLATVVLLGPQLREHAAALGAWVNAQPIRRPGELLFACSPLSDGVILRVGGAAVEPVGRWLRDRLCFIPSLLGDDPWRRKY